MIAHVQSVAFNGIEAVPIEIEVDVSKRGFAGATIVGLPDTVVKESTERVRSALQNSGYDFPRYKIVINLAPADLRKEGPIFDLPIALAMLFACGEIRFNGPAGTNCADGYIVAGELALDGRVRPIKGTLSVAMLARANGAKGVIVPAANAKEAAVVEGIEVIPVESLTESIGFLTGALPIEPTVVNVDELFQTWSSYDCDFAEVRGQEHVKRALTIAAAGTHNILLIGPPGSGKTMLARRLPTILPALTLEESLEATRIHSLAGELRADVPLLATRPVRTPHHTASTAAMVGGGTVPQAGEVSLAHHGVLFLDEFPEFSRSTLEALRQPLEDGEVTIARAHTTTRFPASILLVAAMNPCPCGYSSDHRKACRCTPIQIEKYLGRISGPLVDRIDIHIEVPAVPLGELRSPREGTASAQLCAQVIAARRVQRERFGADRIMANGRMGGRLLRKFCKLNEAAESVLRQAMTEFQLSARAHDKILRISRTIADLGGCEDISTDHVLEAIHYRRLDRKM